MKSSHLTRWTAALLITVAVVFFFFRALDGLRIEMDITKSLPQGDPVLADASFIMANHPMRDRIAIDVGTVGPQEDVRALVNAARFVERELAKSGLVKDIGIGSDEEAFPEILKAVLENLPALFTAGELEEKVKPLLETARVRQAVAQDFASLQTLQGVGSPDFIARDPLGFRNIVLAKLSALLPSGSARVVDGCLVSADSRHALIVAKPAASLVDTEFSRRMDTAINSIAKELEDKSRGAGPRFALSAVGAYRAALDNEVITKADVRMALVVSTVAIIVLLLLGFPRPLIGLFALLPAFAGTMTAIAVYAIFHDGISGLALGFGGAIVSFAVDYGIAYLLFLDRPHETFGFEATRQVWSLGILAMLTTALGFAFLVFSGFPVLEQIGWIASLGVVFTFLFVHAVFPLVFPRLPAARRSGVLPLERFMTWLCEPGPRTARNRAIAVLILVPVMAVFVRPEVRTDFKNMSTLRDETVRAEQTVSDTWGDIFSRIYIMAEAGGVAELRVKGDRLAAIIDKELSAGRISSGFVPSMVFPGEERARANFAAWKSFWNEGRVRELRANLQSSARSVGFAPGAFDPFWASLDRKETPAVDLPESLHRFLGIAEGPEGKELLMFAALTPGKAYDGAGLADKLRSAGIAKVFDGDLFADRLGSVIMSAFTRTALTVGIITALIVFLFFLDWKLTVISLLPTALSLLFTFGTLNILHQPAGIPIIMVTIVVIGMGTDYALYLVRAYQRYLGGSDPGLGLIRLSVLLSFATTVIGFGVLAFARHNLLKSAGLGLTLGIGYSFLFSAVLLPPVLKKIFAPVELEAEEITPGSGRHFSRFLKRYRHMEPYVRMFARFKVKCDPMFPRLAGFVKSPGQILDIGCGYGVPAVWLLECNPEATVRALEPDVKRAAVAARAIGARGTVEVMGAPDLPANVPRIDHVLILDVIHVLDDSELRLLMERVNSVMDTDGTVVIRVTLPSGKGFPWERRLEEWRLKLQDKKPLFRNTESLAGIFGDAGFRVVLCEPSAPGREETWFILKKGRDEAAVL